MMMAQYAAPGPAMGAPVISSQGAGPGYQPVSHGGMGGAVYGEMPYEGMVQGGPVFDGSCADGSCSGQEGGCGAGCSGCMTNLFPNKFGGYCTMHGGKHGPGCCAPRWFDVHAEWIYWQRDESLGDTIPFTSSGIAGPIVLSTDDLSLSEQSGFRITGAYLVGPSANLELSYFGQLNHASSAQVTSPDNDLYSIISEFGTNPFGGFQETDAAYLHRVQYSTEIDNLELNLRRRWVSANCLVHSSLLVGVRYFRLREDFRLYTETDNGELDYLVRTDNDMTGVQLGTNGFLCLSPRFKVGVEVEGGVYGVRAKQETDRRATTIQGVLVENEKDNDAAFLGEAGLVGLFRLTPRATIRGGYTLLYVNGVALATENFNPGNVFTPRESFLNDNGEVLYHGANLGLEFTY